MTVVDGLSKPNSGLMLLRLTCSGRLCTVQRGVPLWGGWDGRVGLPSFKTGMGPAS